MQTSQLDGLYQSLETNRAAASVILKLRGETCNIDCLYCYEKRKESPGGARIDAAQVEQLGVIFGDRPLAIELHGGEPLTAGRDHVGEVLTALANLPQVLSVSMQTNGILLDDAWLDLFDEIYPAMGIGVSLDGDPQGNAWRVGYDGKPTYASVAAALNLLARRGRKVGVITAVTPNISGRPRQVLDHLAQFDAVNAISFVPCFDAAVTKPTASSSSRPPASRVLQQLHTQADTAPSWAITPQQYAEFVLKAGTHWVKEGLFKRIKLEPLVSTIRRIRGLKTSFCHFSDLKCSHVFTLYPNGRFGSCDELPWPHAQLGLLPLINNEGDIQQKQARSRLLSDTRSLMHRCSTCAYQQTCSGGCPASRLRFANAGEEDAYCDHRMRIVDGTAALLANPRDSEAVHCRSLRWNPRTPNTMRDVAGFISTWRAPHADRARVTLRKSGYGNINIVGKPGVHEAPDLDPLHPQWREAIEPGVFSLVNALVTSWGCITYDSCEGHTYEGSDLEPTPVRVGLLPRNLDEHSLLSKALCQLTKATQPKLPPTVILQVGRCELSSDNEKYPVLDIVLAPSTPGRWSEFLASRASGVKVLVETLGEIGLQGAICTCAAGSSEEASRG